MQFSFQKLREGRSPGRKMDYIGKYDNLPVYEANGQAIPKNTSNLYVTAQGTIYFGGVAIGKLDRRNLKVLSYDKDIYYKEMSRQKEALRKEEAKKGSGTHLCGRDCCYWNEWRTKWC